MSEQTDYQTVNRSDARFMTEIRGHSPVQFRELYKQRNSYPELLRLAIEAEEKERAVLCRRGNTGHGWRE